MLLSLLAQTLQPPQPATSPAKTGERELKRTRTGSGKEYAENATIGGERSTSFPKADKAKLIIAALGNESLTILLNLFAHEVLDAIMYLLFDTPPSFGVSSIPNGQDPQQLRERMAQHARHISESGGRKVSHNDIAQYIMANQTQILVDEAKAAGFEPMAAKSAASKGRDGASQLQHVTDLLMNVIDQARHPPPPTACCNRAVHERFHGSLFRYIHTQVTLGRQPGLWITREKLVTPSVAPNEERSCVEFPFRESPLR